MNRRTALTAVGAMLAGLASSVAIASHDGPLVARYDVDEMQTDYAFDKSGHDLTGNGASSVTVVPGRWANAFDLRDDGDGFFVTDNPLFEPAGFSIVAWVKAETSPGNDRVLVAKGGGGSSCANPAYALTTGPTGGLQLSVRLTDGILEAVPATPGVAPSRVWNGAWHAVTATYAPPAGDRGHFLTVWVDGVQAVAEERPQDFRRIAYTQTPPGEGSRFNVGQLPGACEPPRSLKATVDEVRFYDRPLNRNEIRYLHQQWDSPPDLRFRNGPVNVRRPSVTGIPRPGSTLTCNRGEWDAQPDPEPPPDTDPVHYFFNWERAPRATRFEDDEAWAPIDGAAAETYQVQSVDVPSRVRCRVTVRDGTGTTDEVSASLRADTAAPRNLALPRVEGVPISGAVNGQRQAAVCNPGEWENQGEFKYQWQRDGVPIPGATDQRYFPRASRGFFGRPDGDGNHLLMCRVQASNDVGSTASIFSNQVLAIDGTPALDTAFNDDARRPRTFISPESADPNPLNRRLNCQTGRWVDDYAARRVPGHEYEYEWWRGGLDGAQIAGATGSEYKPTVEDLGRRILCKVSTSNPVGRSPFEHSSNNVTVPLPPPGADRAFIYKTDPRGPADPTNLLAMSEDYLKTVQDLVIERLERARQAAIAACRGENISPFALNIPFGRPVTPYQRCWILRHHPDRVRLHQWGAFYVVDNCIISSGSSGFIQFGKLCPNLGLAVAPVDPKAPPPDDPELAARLRGVTPQRILWDFNADGRTDVACPGSAPVLRTILPEGNWTPRAVIIRDDSAQSGRFPSGDTRFNLFGGKNAGVLRRAQVKVCSTSFRPPPDPEKAPCITEGDLGTMHVEGDLCPIDVREIASDDYKNLPSSMRSMLHAISANRLRGEGQEAQAARRRAAADVVYVPAWEGRRRPRAQTGLALGGERLGREQFATYANTAASMTTAYNPAQVQIPQKMTAALDKVPKFDVKKTGFAAGQIYASRGDVVSLNGVTVDPINGAKALLIPSDIGQAFPSTKLMTVNVRDAATFLGEKATGLPLSDKGELERRISDKAGEVGNTLLAETNLDQLVARLQSAANKLNLGPFKLRGAAQVNVEKDGTATLKASAVLPGLKLGAGSSSTEARADITLRGDREGRVKLDGVRLKPPGIAYLGGVALEGVDITWQNGLDIRGKLLFPPPVGAGIAINQFKLGPGGEFRILDVDYLAGAGTGIKVGPGVFLTKIGGRLDLENDTIGGNATISVGPSTGGGCPTAGINAEFKAHFARPIWFDATGTVLLACIDIARAAFHADEEGFVEFSASIDKELGPIYIKGGFGAAIRMPDWMGWLDGEGGVSTPLGRIGYGFSFRISNRGLAGCGRIEIPLLPDPAAGAGIRFPGGRPPLHVVELLANLRFFLGCDLGDYETVVRRPRAAAAQDGATVFDIPRGAPDGLLSIEGDGGAPRVRLRSPSGQVLDYSDAPLGQGKVIGATRGGIIETEDRTVVLGRMEPGRWTIETATPSARIVRVQRAPFLPKPQVRARVSGSGARRVLSYDIAPLRGQRVRLVERARGTQQILRTVREGGRGQVPFTVGEADERRRRIIAEVEQNGMPRAHLTVARYSAANPRVGRPRGLRVVRRGRGARVTWRGATFARTYEILVTTSDGRRWLLRPRAGARRATIGRVARDERVVVTVRPFSVTGRSGPAATARLRESVRRRSARSRARTRR